METQGLVHTTLAGLKQRLSPDATLHVQKEEGFAIHQGFTFHPPATEAEIEAFCQETGWVLPEDYREFLLLHNGAILFQEESGHGDELLGLQASRDYHEGYELPPTWMPIVWEMTSFIIIDTERVKAGRKDYLLWLGTCYALEDVMDLGLNFALWLDRYIVSQGSEFWLWPTYHVDF